MTMITASNRSQDSPTIPYTLSVLVLTSILVSHQFICTYRAAPSTEEMDRIQDLFLLWISISYHMW